MKSISLWARHHRPAAILIIILAKLLLAGTAIYTGILFTRAGISFSTGWIYLYAALFMAVAFLYGSQAANYYRRKLMDGLLLACTFLMVVVFSNNGERVNFTMTGWALTAPTTKEKPTAKQILASLEHRDKKDLTRREKRILKQEFQVQLKQFVAAKIKGDKQKSSEAGSIILLIVAALGLGFLLASLVCSLSCSGAEAAAIIVGIVGFVGLIWLLAIMIKRIKRKQKARLASPA
ncbi:MAG: hypothetical protein EOO03_18380 [Chitinophagaceae bacterium]|nr:MAG: hypothetical protein EOO03_18380 [Chitinophagaceae bacterium]